MAVSRFRWGDSPQLHVHEVTAAKISKILILARHSIRRYSMYGMMCEAASDRRPFAQMQTTGWFNFYCRCTENYSCGNVTADDVFNPSPPGATEPRG
jgi:hypothetical protein